MQCYSPPRVSDPEELLSQNGKPTNDSQENQTNLVNKNEALATSNMDLRNKTQVSATESNSSNNEKDLGKKDNEYKDLKNSLNRDVPDNESISNCSARLIGTTESTITYDYCGFFSDDVPELKLHKADAHDGLIFWCNQYEVTNIKKATLLNHEDKRFQYKLCECDKETKRLQTQVQSKHINDPLNKRKINETVLEIKIVTQGNANPG